MGEAKGGFQQVDREWEKDLQRDHLDREFLAHPSNVKRDSLSGRPHELCGQFPLEPSLSVLALRTEQPPLERVFPMLNLLF